MRFSFFFPSSFFFHSKKKEANHDALFSIHLLAPRTSNETRPISIDRWTRSIPSSQHDERFIRGTSDSGNVITTNTRVVFLLLFLHRFQKRDETTNPLSTWTRTQAGAPWISRGSRDDLRAFTHSRPGSKSIGEKNGGSRDSPRGRGPRYRRGGRACTRSRVLVSGATCVIRHWRQGRDRAGGCAQGRLPLYYGDSGRVHTVLPRESKSPRVSAARTHGTHTQQGRPRPASRVLPPPPPQSSYFPGPWAPFTPTAPPRSATNRYHSNRKISQWTRILHDSPFPSIFFSFSNESPASFFFFFFFFRFLFLKEEVVVRRRSIRSWFSDLAIQVWFWGRIWKRKIIFCFFFWRRSVRRIRFLLNLIFNESSSRNIIINK